MAKDLVIGGGGIWNGLGHLTLEEHNVLVVDPDNSTIDDIASSLHGSNLNVDTANSGKEAIAKLGKNYYDVVIFPYTGVPNNGQMILDLIKPLDTQAIVTASQYNESLEEQVLGAGAYSIIDKPIKPSRMRLNVINAIKHIKSYRDGKTGLYTAGIFEDRLNEEINNLVGRREFHEEFTTRRRASPYLSVLLVDFDGFKMINDTYGHIDGGDRVLKAVAEEIKRHKRLRDFAGRIGGDEYAIAFPGLDYNLAFLKGEEIRSNVENLGIRSEDGRIIPATITIGFATIPYSGIPPTTDGILKAADQALYYLKNNGQKNNVMGYRQLDLSK